MKSAETKNMLEVTTPSDREVVMTRTFNAPRELIFDAFTKPELVQRWLLGPEGWTMPICELDLKVGGAFRYVWRNGEGHEFGLGGVYREIVRPERIVHTERFEGPLDSGESVTTNEFVERDGSTQVTMTCLYPSREVRDMAIESGMEKGVAASFDRLVQIVE